MIIIPYLEGAAHRISSALNFSFNFINSQLAKVKDARCKDRIGTDI